MSGFCKAEKRNGPCGCRGRAHTWRLGCANYVPHAVAGVDPRSLEIQRLNALINAPELVEFSAGVVREAAHQRERYPSEHDAGKAPSDWFWLVGYLAGKALHAAITGDRDKALHHCISTAAALANWHAALLGAHTAMRPGIASPDDRVSS